MGYAILMNNGSSNSSDETTAIAENVLVGATYVGADTNDDIGIGKMQNYSNTNSQAVVDNSAVVDNVAKVTITIPKSGYYNQNSKLYANNAEFGNASVSQVLYGSTFTSNAGFKKTGSMPNKAGQTISAIVKNVVSGKMIVNIPESGYYGTNSSLAVSPNEKIGDATLAQVRRGSTFSSKNGIYVTGTAPLIAETQALQYKPSKTSVVLAKGSYLENNVTFLGDNNLIPSNIKYGVKIGDTVGTNNAATAGGDWLYYHGWSPSLTTKNITNMGSGDGTILYTTTDGDRSCIIVVGAVNLSNKTKLHIWGSVLQGVNANQILISDTNNFSSANSIKLGTKLPDGDGRYNNPHYAPFEISSEAKTHTNTYIQISIPVPSSGSTDEFSSSLANSRGVWGIHLF